MASRSSIAMIGRDDDPAERGERRRAPLAVAAIAGKDARTLARDLLALSDEAFRIAFRGSPMKRAKLGGLKRNAAVVLGSVGEANVPTRAG